MAGGGGGWGADYSLGEMAVSWKGHSMLFLSWSENNFLCGLNILMLYCVVPGVSLVTRFQNS